jgi:hypothetical protein
MRILPLLSLLFILNNPSFASRLELLAGKTFSYPGPNCFGVSMYANGNISQIRGVDLLEFSEFVIGQCEEVDEPQKGDLGTFHNGSDFIHAFVFMGDGLVLEKTGVDYLGKTPIHLRDISHTIYTFEASPECRRWGGGSRDCYNTLKYFRCQSGPGHDHRALNELEIEIEMLFSKVLEGRGTQKIMEKLKGLISKYNEQAEVSDEPLIKARLESFKKQLLFF